MNFSLKKIFFFIFFVFDPRVAPHSEEFCTRMARVQFQEILVDISPILKAEGLRPYLKKDPEALKYFNKYQNFGERKLPQALIGTIATGLLLAGGIVRGTKTSRKAWMISGLSLHLVNFFIWRTLEYSNEFYLLRAIEEHNKRRSPKIDLYFQTDHRKKVNKASYKDLLLLKIWKF